MKTRLWIQGLCYFQGPTVNLPEDNISPINPVIRKTSFDPSLFQTPKKSHNISKKQNQNNVQHIANIRNIKSSYIDSIDILIIP